MVCFQIDDTVSAGISSFMKMEEHASVEYPSNGRQMKCKEKTKFNIVEVCH